MPPLPIPVTNNAVAALTVSGVSTAFSFLGLDTTKRWTGVTNRAFGWRVGAAAWIELPPVPGPGRLAATAQAVGTRVFLFGGYTVAEDGSEKSLPSVDVWEFGERVWGTASPMPLPVDDAVSGVWNDSLIFIVSGWHDTNNVEAVQVFDPAANQWSTATPFPGTSVFGHVGGIAGNTIVIVDGVQRNSGRPRYTMARQAWRGDIDPADPTSIRWSRIDHPPSPVLYRAAGFGTEDWVVLAGGSNNPYNYNGIGYNGEPSNPSSFVTAFNVQTGRWHTLSSLPRATMDHRGLVLVQGSLFLIGGMTEDQTVSDLVFAVSWDRLFSR